MSIAQFIDHTILKNTTTIAEVEKICEEAAEYNFAAVCIPPYYVTDAKEFLKNKKIKVATVIGFPYGYHQYQTKVTEALTAINDGANELDMVMNISAFRNNDIAYLENEIYEMTNLIENKEVLIKVIIESGILTAEEIIRCCDLYKHFNVAYLKTSTGFASTGATIEAVQIMRKHLPAHIHIKASGGIRTYEFAKQLIDAGATRLGCSASVAILKEETLRLAD
jgi:deoxyribose-phosphate aldolase